MRPQKITFGEMPTRLRQLLAGGNLIASLGNPCVPPMRPRARRGGLGDDPDEMAPGVITSMDADDEASDCPHYRGLANRIIDQQFAIAADELDAVSCRPPAE
jgi:hypothetical protein